MVTSSPALLGGIEYVDGDQLGGVGLAHTVKRTAQTAIGPPPKRMTGRFGLA
jgi:hypothetical protein